MVVVTKPFDEALCKTEPGLQASGTSSVFCGLGLLNEILLLFETQIWIINSTQKFDMVTPRKFL